MFLRSISLSLFVGVSVLLGLETSASAGCNFHGCSQVPGVECNFHGCPNPPNGGACTFHGCPPATPVSNNPPANNNGGGYPVMPVVVPVYPGVYPPPQQQQQQQPKESLADCIIKIRANSESPGWAPMSMEAARRICTGQ